MWVLNGNNFKHFAQNAAVVPVESVRANKALNINEFMSILGLAAHYHFTDEIKG